MAYDERIREDLTHRLLLEGRERLSISGTTDVESFDENTVVMETTRGMLIIKGEALHMAKLSLDVGEVLIEGQINSVEYEDTAAVSGGFFSRIFR